MAREAVEAGLAAADLTSDAVPDAIDAATWWPAYVPYEPLRFAERRRESEA